MYEPGTILTLKKPHDPDPETGEAFPYNRVRVINQSPVSHADKGDWQGVDAAGVLLEGLTNFGSTLDYPFGHLTEIYDVESIPEVVQDLNPKVRIINATSAQAGPTPEEVFAVEAPGAAPEEGQTRARSHPLGEVTGPADAIGPLGPTRKPKKA